jgi:hypothetical protein
MFHPWCGVFTTLEHINNYVDLQKNFDTGAERHWKQVSNYREDHLQADILTKGCWRFEELRSKTLALPPDFYLQQICCSWSSAWTGCSLSRHRSVDTCWLTAFCRWVVVTLEHPMFRAAKLFNTSLQNARRIIRSKKWINNENVCLNKLVGRFEAEAKDVSGPLRYGSPKNNVLLILLENRKKRVPLSKLEGKDFMAVVTKKDAENT